MSADRPLAGKAAFVTGASGGIGGATARAFARDGAAVALAARRADRLEALAAEIEDDYAAEALAVETDVTALADVEAAVDTAVDAFGGLDVVANIAGLSAGGRIDDTTVEDFRLMEETNVGGTFHTTKASLPHLRDSQGILILISSYAGNFPYPRNPVYGGTRWWIRGFARSIEADVGRDGVAVGVVNPSEVRTRVWRDTYDEGEISEPEEVAEAIAFMAAQSELSTVSELNLHHRSKLADVF